MSISGWEKDKQKCCLQTKSKEFSVTQEKHLGKIYRFQSIALSREGGGGGGELPAFVAAALLLPVSLYHMCEFPRAKQTYYVQKPTKLQENLGLLCLKLNFWLRYRNFPTAITSARKKLEDCTKKSLFPGKKMFFKKICDSSQSTL